MVCECGGPFARAAAALHGREVGADDYKAGPGVLAVRALQRQRCFEPGLDWRGSLHGRHASSPASVITIRKFPESLPNRPPPSRPAHSIVTTERQMVALLAALAILQ